MEWKSSKKGWLSLKVDYILVGVNQTKWVVLYSKPVPSIAIYDERAQSQPPYCPRHHLTLQDCTVTRRNTKKFEIYSKSYKKKVNILTKFTFTAQNEQTLLDWLDAIGKLSNPKPEQEQPNAPLLSKYPDITFKGVCILSGSDIESSLGKFQRGFQALNTPKDFFINNVALSTVKAKNISQMKPFLLQKAISFIDSYNYLDSNDDIIVSENGNVRISLSNNQGMAN